LADGSAQAVNDTEVNWRVTKWRRSEDRRWIVLERSDHHYWETAMATARHWIQDVSEEIEAGQLRIQVDSAGR
jgi:hypothetical protein